MRLLYWLIAVVSLCFTAPSGKASAQNFGPPSKEYGFPVGTVEESAFRLSCDDTTVTISGSLPRVDLRLEYLGRGVVWQAYGVVDDQFVVEAVESNEALQPTDRFLKAAQRRAELDSGRLDAFEDGFTLKCTGLVLSDDTIDTASIRQYYIDAPYRAPYIGKGDSPEAIEASRREMSRICEIWSARFSFSGKAYPFSVDLGEYYTVQKPGLYCFRIGYCLYPRTNWYRYTTKLQPRWMVWSPDFVVEVR